MYALVSLSIESLSRDTRNLLKGSLNSFGPPTSLPIGQINEVISECHQLICEVPASVQDRRSAVARRVKLLIAISGTLGRELSGVGATHLLFLGSRSALADCFTVVDVSVSLASVDLVRVSESFSCCAADSDSTASFLGELTSVSSASKS